MPRDQFSNQVMSMLTNRDGWTRNIPLAFQKGVLPGVTPAKESDGGRGAVFFDVWRKYEIGGLKVNQAAGFKICKNIPNSVMLTKGTAEHLQAVLDAAESGVQLPCIVLLHHEDDWYATHFDITDLIKKYSYSKATQGQGKGRGQASAVSYGTTTQTTRVKTRGGFTKEYQYEYLYLQVNLDAAGLEFNEVSHPSIWDFSKLTATYYDVVAG